MTAHQSPLPDVAPASEEHPERTWLVEAAGRRFGPLSTLELAYAARHGILTGECLIWRDGLPRWFLAGEVAGLIPDEAAGRSTDRARPVQNRLLPQSSRSVEASSDQPLTTEARLISRDEARFVPNVGRRSYEISTFDDAGQPTVELPASLSSVAAVPLLATVTADTQRLQTLGLVEHSEPVQHSRAFDPLRRCEAIADREMAPYFSTVELEVNDAGASRSVTRRIAETIAQQIVVVLRRNDIDSIDELTSNSRLRGLATVVFDTAFELLPAARFTISRSVGREFVEERIFDILLSVRGALLRTSLTPDDRARDLQKLVLDQAPELARSIDESVASTVGNVSAMIKTNWSMAVGLFRSDQTAEIATAQPALLTVGG